MGAVRMIPMAEHKHVALTDLCHNHCILTIRKPHFNFKSLHCNLISTAEKMYELTIDGVPFSLLQPHNPYPPRRPGMSKDSGGARQASTRKFQETG